jgi:hypothetical protein
VFLSFVVEKSTRTTPKQEIKLKAQSEKQKLIWRKKLHKMLKAIPRFFGNMLTPKEKLTLIVVIGFAIVALSSFSILG